MRGSSTKSYSLSRLTSCRKTSNSFLTNRPIPTNGHLRTQTYLWVYLSGYRLDLNNRWPPPEFSRRCEAGWPEKDLQKLVLNFVRCVHIAIRALKSLDYIWSGSTKPSLEVWLKKSHLRSHLIKRLWICRWKWNLRSLAYQVGESQSRRRNVLTPRHGSVQSQQLGCRWCQNRT